MSWATSYHRVPLLLMYMALQREHSKDLSHIQHKEITVGWGIGSSGENAADRSIIRLRPCYQRPLGR